MYTDRIKREEVEIFCIINVGFGIVNSIIGFSNSNTSAGLGWMCSELGWLGVLLECN